MLQATSNYEISDGNMADAITSIETFLVTINTPGTYLSGEFKTPQLEKRGYMISPANNTIYPLDFKSIVVKVTTASGVIGWGETYGICAPLAVKAIHEDIIAPYLSGRDPLDVQVLWDEIYDLMRVRGYTGYYLDALAAVDIALWDICGKIHGVPVMKLLGGRRRSAIPAYVSGLNAPTMKEKIELAKYWTVKGFTAIKIHATHSNNIAVEIATLRQALGPDIELMVDLHWAYTSAEAAQLISRLEPFHIAFAEAPCKPEDIGGLAALAARVSTPIAAGEEWRTVHDAVPRLTSDAVRIVQPEMGHTGITQFMRIATLAEAFNARVAPHATIGCGIFMTASLHAAASIAALSWHEFHGKFFENYENLLDEGIRCGGGFFTAPSGPGLGITPNQKLWDNAERL